MKRLLHLYIFSLSSAIMMLWGCTGNGGSSDLALDSHSSDVEAINAAHAALQRATDYSRSDTFPQYDSVLVISEQLLTSKVVQNDPSFQEKVLELLVYASRQIGDYELQLDYSTRLAEAYREHGALIEALRTQAEIGSVLYRLGQTVEGLVKMDSAIHALSPVRRFNELDASIISMKRKISVVRDYPLIISEAQHILDRLSDYEQHPNDFSDGSSREPEVAERADYISFYRAQAWMYLASAYAHLNKLDEARDYLSKAEQTDFGKTLSGKKMMAPTFFLLGDDQKMGQIYEELEALFVNSGDTLTLDYAQLLLDRAKAYERRGLLRESNACWEKHARILQQTDERLLRGKASLYAARYQLQEQQIAIAKQQEEIRQKNMICIFLGIELVVLLAVMLYILRQQLILRQKDSVLAREISEAIKLRNQYETAEFSHPTSPADEEPDSEDLSSLTDEQLFEYIYKIVIRDELFLDPNFDRQTLCERLSLTKEQVGAAFSKGSPYTSVTDFINNCRLPYAAKLLIERPELSVAEVARISGFTRADTLTNNFKRRYTLTPTQYRAQVK